MTIHLICLYPWTTAQFDSVPYTVGRPLPPDEIGLEIALPTLNGPLFSITLTDSNQLVLENRTGTPIRLNGDLVHTSAPLKPLKTSLIEAGDTAFVLAPSANSAQIAAKHYGNNHYICLVDGRNTAPLSEQEILQGCQNGTFTANSMLFPILAPGRIMRMRQLVDFTPATQNQSPANAPSIRPILTCAILLISLLGVILTVRTVSGKKSRFQKQFEGQQQNQLATIPGSQPNPAPTATAPLPAPTPPVAAPAPTATAPAPAPISPVAAPAPTQSNLSHPSYTKATSIQIGSPQPHFATTNWGTLFYYRLGSRMLTSAPLSVIERNGQNQFAPAPMPANTIRLWLHDTTLWIDITKTSNKDTYWFRQTDQINLDQTCFGPDPDLQNFIRKIRPSYTICCKTPGQTPQLQTFNQASSTLDTTTAIRALGWDNPVDLITNRDQLRDQIQELKSECESLGYQLTKSPSSFLSQEDIEKLDNLKDELDNARYRERTANGPWYYHGGRTRPARRAIKDIQRNIDSVNQKAAIQYNQQKQRYNDLRSKLKRAQGNIRQLEQEIENRQDSDILTRQLRNTQFLIKELHIH